jgi:pimeloyl-ACP methyl ester carboxylesterase
MATRATSRARRCSLPGQPTGRRRSGASYVGRRNRYHVIAPDLPGFGFSEAPDRDRFAYTFDHLAKIVDGLLDTLDLRRYAIYVFDYGAPVGFRLALAHPEPITAIVSQNGNAYEEGLSDGWNPIQKYWQEPAEANRTALRDFLMPEATRWQYLHGVSDEAAVAPESYTLDPALLGREGNDEIQLDLFLDYASNVALYPRFQAYFPREPAPDPGRLGHERPVLPAAGRPGVPARRAECRRSDHFALETHAREIASAIREFLAKADTARTASEQPVPMRRRSA